MPKFAVPGLVLRSTCPTCGEVLEVDLAHYQVFSGAGEQKLQLSHYYKKSHRSTSSDVHRWEVLVRLEFALTALDGCEVALVGGHRG